MESLGTFEIQLCQSGGLRPYHVTTVRVDTSCMTKPMDIGGMDISPSGAVGKINRACVRMVSMLWSATLIQEGDSVLEIGVDFGDGISRYLKRNPSLVVGVDPYMSSSDDSWYGQPQDQMDARFQIVKNRFSENKNFILVREESDTFFSKLDSKVKYNFIYIDGLHTEEACLSDLRNAFKHAATGAYILCDDVDDRRWGRGISSAWKRFKDEHEGKINVLWDVTSPAMCRVL